MYRLKGTTKMDLTQTKNEVMIWMEINQGSAQTRVQLKAKKAPEYMHIVLNYRKLSAVPPPSKQNMHLNSDRPELLQTNKR
jgi:negative regulator of genetic competence, sporulation and motility